MKEKIIKKAYELLKEKKFEDLTINEICGYCEISKPTFYKYIGNKENLLTFFYTDITNNYASMALTLLAEDNYWKSICAGFDMILGWSSEFGYDLYSQLFITNLKENKGTFLFDENLTKVMQSLYSKAQKNGQIRNQSNPEELYLNCANLSFGYGINWCLNGGKSDLLNEFRRALENVCDVAPEYRTIK